jgi:hypothetical protein
LNRQGNEIESCRHGKRYGGKGKPHHGRVGPRRSVPDEFRELAEEDL